MSDNIHPHTYDKFTKIYNEKKIAVKTWHSIICHMKLSSKTKKENELVESRFV